SFSGAHACELRTRVRGPQAENGCLSTHPDLVEDATGKTVPFVLDQARIVTTYEDRGGASSEATGCGAIGAIVSHAKAAAPDGRCGGWCRYLLRRYHFTITASQASPVPMITVISHCSHVTRVNSYTIASIQLMVASQGGSF